MDIVKTDSGDISGIVLGDPGRGVNVYRGIPYAAPPIGDLRWKPPQPVIPWTGVRECSSYSKVAPQPRDPSNFTGEMPQSEDCLYLNVLTPAKRDSEKLPVMVWLHGGSFNMWSGNDRPYNQLWLPLKGVVLVNVNMRLGPIGLLAHTLLSQESPQGASGNYMFLDIIAALKWVQKNIAEFGGNPDNVTIFGESGGSAKTVNLMASPLAKGLFHQAIGESGGGAGTRLEEMESRGQRVFDKLGIEKEKNQLSAARAVPWEKIIEASQSVTEEMKIPLGPWDSTVDGWFLPDTTANIFKAGKQNVIPFIMGANLGELIGPTTALPFLVASYVSLFKCANKVGVKAYAYIFNHLPAGWRKELAMAPHATEIPYVFGDMDGKSDIFSWMEFPLARTFGSFTAKLTIDDSDRKVSELMMDLWTNFAQKGNPSLEGVVEWPVWDENTDQYLYITESPEVRSRFSKIIEDQS